MTPNEPNNEINGHGSQAETACENEAETALGNAAEKIENSTVRDESDVKKSPLGRHGRTFRLRTLIISCVSCALAGALLVLIFVPNSLRLWVRGNTALDKLSALDAIIKKNYIYADQIDDEQLADTLAWGYVYGLGDKYSAYYDAEQYTALKYSNAGQTYGIGVTVVLYEERGGIYVVSVTNGSPAEAAGMQKGDLITAVEGTAVTAENYSQLVADIHGELGTAVKLTLLRGGETIDMSVMRGEYISNSVTGEMLGETGYIEISTFNETTATQFNDVLDSQIAQGAKSLIIDLRGNTGGLVSAASSVLDRLLPECDLAYAVYNDGSRQVLATSDSDCVDLPIAVLTDGNSASSSEYVASALRDIAGAKLVGSTTYGKGIMQSTYPLGDGSAVRVTVAEIYSAAGNRYHGTGLAPDIEAGYTAEQQRIWFLLEGKDDPFIAAAIEALSESL